jgi:hypothetical protein
MNSVERSEVDGQQCAGSVQDAIIDPDKVNSG